MRKFNVAKGMRQDSNKIKNATVTWSRLCEVFTQHVHADSKDGEYIVGGHYQGDTRSEAALLGRSLLTLDIDGAGVDVDGLALDLQLGLDCAFIAYSTFNHTPEAPRLRVIIPLSRDVTPNEYRALSRSVVDNLDIDGVDSCSFVPNQAMFYPKCPHGVEGWSLVQDGEPYSVPDEIAAPVVVMDDDDELSIAVAMRPLDLSIEQVAEYLRAFPAEGRHYDDWFMVGAAIKHQTGASEAGFQVWLDWSAQSSKHDATQMRKKWLSIDVARAKPITFASIIAKVRDSVVIDGEVVLVDETKRSALFEELCYRASEVESVEQYEALKLEIRELPEVVLARDARAMIAAELVDSFGRDNGLTKSEIKRELVAVPNKKTQRIGGQTNTPPWLSDWVYVEVTCEYYNIQLGYGIKREAFNAKFGREIEVLMAEKTASDYALVDCLMPCVVDKMYWPGADRFFSYEGKQMVNVYHESGTLPCEALDDDGREVIGRFMDHMALLFSNERERRIALDWMAYVCQNPGKRVSWALLVQGSQGVGKTYLANVLQLVMGVGVRMLDPTAIAGRFTGWAHGARVIVVEEIRISGTNKHEILDRMKPFISNHDVQIEEKGRDHRTVPNFSSYLLLTNAKDSVPIVEDDRRYCPIFTDVQTQQDLFARFGGERGAAAYFDSLFDNSRRRADALAHLLMNWEISDSFNPTSRAPTTEAKREMMALSKSPDRHLIEDMIDLHECDVINKHIIDLTHLGDLCTAEGVDLPKARTVTAVLLEMGYRKVDGGKIKINRTRRNHYVWFGAQYNSEMAKERCKSFHSDTDEPPF